MAADRNFKIHYALLPFSWLYGLGVWFRNKLFDMGILRSEEFEVPVICVGNLSVGGTGKTPHTELLINLLNRKYRVAVLSRGYKRKTKGFVLADQRATSDTIGDEPFQMCRKFPHIVVAVDSDRRRGIRQLLNLPEKERPQVILLDDAFQHRYVHPSLAIVLTDYNRMIYEDALLPAGRLREPLSGLQRAQIVVVTKCPDTLKPLDYRIARQNLELFPYQQLFFSSYSYGALRPVFPSVFYQGEQDHVPLEELRASILLVTGIASPQVLIREIEQYHSNIRVLSYPDHHDFSETDIATIVRTFHDMEGEKRIVTTEKDAARLLDNPYLPEEIKPYIYYIPIEVRFQAEQDIVFTQIIDNHVTNVTRDRILAEASAHS